MSLIRRMRQHGQFAIYWRQKSNDKYGDSAFDEPVEIAVRWEDKITEVRDAMGNVSTFNSVVYVDREMNVGDVLKKGELDSDTPESPNGLSGALRIQRFEALPNLRNTETLYTAYV